MTGKYAFFAISLLMSIFMPFLSFSSAKKNDVNGKPLAFMIGIAFLSVIFYNIHILVENITLAYIFADFFYSSITTLLFSIFLYAYFFTDEYFYANKTIIKVYFVVFWIVAFFDISILLLNVFGEHNAFTLTPYFIQLSDGTNKFYCWIRHDKTPFRIHLALSYLQTVFIFYLLISKIFSTQKLYRNKYLYILYALIFVILADALFVYFDSIKLNYSILVYALFAIGAYYISFYLVHNEIVNKIVKIISNDIDSGIVCFDIEQNCIYVNEKANLLFEGKKSAQENAQNYLREKIVSTRAKSADNLTWSENFLLNTKNTKVQIQNQQNQQNAETLAKDVSSEQANQKSANQNPQIQNQQTEHNFKVEYHLLRDPENKILGSYLSLEDQSLLLKKYEEQSFKASHDSLTGLYTREAFFEIATNMILKEPSVKRYLMATNIKNFKLINDFFGTEVGDEILRQKAKILTDVNYPDFIVGRISGDRFAILLNQEDYNIGDYLEKSFKIQESLKAKNYKINFEIGIYPVENGESNVQSMFDKASLALKYSRDSYESRPIFYDNKLMEDLLYEKTIILDFDRALKNDEFCIFLHPQFDIHKNPIGAEALVRWRHPTKGLLQPNQFVPILERTGYIAKLDKFIWESACQILKKWKDLGKTQYSISVNISNNDFFYEDVYKDFIELVKKYKINPSNLNLEITENVVMNDSSQTLEVIKELRKFGFKIEMDDFGTGLSSLNVLKNVEMDVLKIDMEFLAIRENLNQVQSVKVEEKRQIILSALIKMAKLLKMNVITEGVQNEEQLKSLIDWGSDAFQGYYFSKPIPVGDFENFYFWK